MTDVGAMLDEWHDTIGEPSVLSGGFEVHSLRRTLITEEYLEVMEAMGSEPVTGEAYINLAKELADLVYVLYGTARAYGIPLDRVIEAVHASNMSKLKGGIERQPDGKIIKGPHYEEPVLEPLLSYGGSE
jgi:predicted HAD superfamily Cof-like phosphohydrolase